MCPESMESTPVAFVNVDRHCHDLHITAKATDPANHVLNVANRQRGVQKDDLRLVGSKPIRKSIPIGENTGNFEVLGEFRADGLGNRQVVVDDHNSHWGLSHAT